MHRLHEIVVHLDADRFAHRGVVFALCDHHDGHGGIDQPDFRQQIEPAPAGHLLVEQHDAVGLAPQQRERVVAVRRLLHGESLLFEIQAMRGEPFHLVIHPENALGARHRRETSPTGGPGQRAPTLPAC
jgi:hypothetical protein